jgi:anaerobic selenocysteine-containing dehydrogenase
MSTTEKGPWKWEEDGMVVTRGIARTAPGCHEGCGVLIYVKDERIVKVEGDPNFLLNRGRLCPGCRALLEVVYHPNRLSYPLKRAGKRRRGKMGTHNLGRAYEAIANTPPVK